MAKADKISPAARLLDRLARVEGQVRGLRKMIEEDRDCEEVLTQLKAARSGLEQAAVMLIDRHITNCILGDNEIPPEAMEKLRETMRLLVRA